MVVVRLVHENDSFVVIKEKFMTVMEGEVRGGVDD
jgi:hypothetical protein